MAELSCRPHRTAIEPVVEDEAAAHAGAEREHDDMSGLARGAKPVLGDRCGVAVVFDQDGNPEAVPEAIAKVDAGERDVHRGDRAPRALVDRRRNPYAERSEPPFGEAPDDALELGEHRVLAREVGRLDGATNDRSV